jgi:nucleotide-binding universal stress UspA family protein
MDIKQILLLVSGASAQQEAMSVASTLARQEGAVVHGICLFHEPAVTLADSFAVGRLGIEAVLDHRDQTLSKLVAPSEKTFDEVIASRGLSVTWELAEADGARDEVVMKARLADLVVISAASDDGAQRRMTEQLVIESGAPCLILPAAPVEKAGFRRIVIGWNHSKEAKRALSDAMFLLKRAEDVALVVVGEEPDPCSASAEALQRVLTRHGVTARLRYVTAGDRGDGQALADEAEAFEADLIVMGAFGHSRAAEMILGGATHDLILRGRLPVFMSH